MDPIVAAAGGIVIDGPNVYITFPQVNPGERLPVYRKRVAKDYRTKSGRIVKIRPGPSLCKAARSGEVTMDQATAQMEIRYAEAQALRYDRFEQFCREDGIPENGQKVREDGSTDYYAPDAMGYPTLVMRKDAAGEWI
jgi:hypothetical protein